MGLTLLLVSQTQVLLSCRHVSTKCEPSLFAAVRQFLNQDKAAAQLDSAESHINICCLVADKLRSSANSNDSAGYLLGTTLLEAFTISQSLAGDNARLELLITKQLQLVLGATASAIGKTIRVLSLGPLPASSNFSTVLDGAAGSAVSASELEASYKAHNSEEQVEWATFVPQIPGVEFEETQSTAETSDVISLLYLFDHHFDLLSASSVDTGMRRKPDKANDTVRISFS
jgi:hypothetical protein